MLTQPSHRADGHNDSSSRTNPHEIHEKYPVFFSILFLNTEPGLALVLCVSWL